jgi:hypothetical protein
MLRLTSTDLSIFFQNLFVEEGLSPFFLKLILDFLKLMLSVLEYMLVFLLDLLAGLVWEVLLEQGEVRTESNDELDRGRGTSQRRFYSSPDHFLLYLLV